MSGAPSTSLHVAIWLGAAVAFRLLIWPLLAAGSLDVELLIVNLYEQQAAPKELVPLVLVLMRWGLAPLGILAGAALGYRVARRPNPVAAWPRGRRAALGLAAFLAFAAAAIPLSVAISIWVCVEGFHWIEWQLDINPFSDDVLRWGPILTLPGLLVMGLRTQLFALGWAPSRKRGPLRFAARTLAAIPLVAASLTCLVVIGAASPQISRAATASGRAAFEANCGDCHFRTLGLTFDKTPDEWEATIKRMATTVGRAEWASTRAEMPEGAGVMSAEDLVAVTEWLSSVRSQGDFHVFRTRCLRCHGTTHTTWEAREPQQWADLVERMARWSPSYFRIPEKERIKGVLADEHGRSGATLGLSTEDWARFERVGEVCQPCHSISWNAEHYREASFDEARTLIGRMNQKLVDPIPEEEIDDFTRAWQDLIADPNEFDRLFPHDFPIPEPKLPGPEREHRQVTPDRGGY